jgi:LPXTG-motif cell wall-anchored protein
MITLVKKVVNDDAGTAEEGDWTLSADGPTPISGASGTSEVTRAAVDAGAYDLAESGGPDGYESGAWVCSSEQTRSAARVVLEPGDRVTCTITNDDVADQSGDGRDDDSGSDEDSDAGDNTASGSAEDSGATGAGSGLPDTGAPFATWLVALGAALLLGGSGLVVAARRGSAGQVRHRGP